MKTMLMMTTMALASAGAMALTTAAPSQDSTTVRGDMKVSASEEKNTETFSIDTGHSMVIYRVQHLKAGMFWGRINGVSGTIEMGDNPEKDAKINIAVDMDTIDSGIKNLDDHLKNSDFFSVEEFPTATFVSKALKKTGENMYDVTGDFTLRGVTKEITVPVEWFGTSNIRGKRCGAEAVFTIKRSDYGIMYGVEAGALGDETRVIVALEGVVREETAQPRRPRGSARTLDFDEFDANDDGQLDQDELPGRLARMFDRLDTNGDGTLDKDEFKVLQDRMSGRRSGGGSRN